MMLSDLIQVRRVIGLKLLLLGLRFGQISPLMKLVEVNNESVS